MEHRSRNQVTRICLTLTVSWPWPRGDDRWSGEVIPQRFPWHRTKLQYAWGPDCPPRTHQAKCWSALSSTDTLPLSKFTIHALVGLPTSAVADQYSDGCTALNGWLGGRARFVRFASSRLASWSNEGSFHPFRPPTARSAQRSRAVGQSIPNVAGFRSQTSCVSLSKTASLVNSLSTSNRTFASGV